MVTPKTRFKARASSVIDGDTFWTESPSVKVRLARVNAPEMGSPGGDRARQTLSAKILGQIVDIDPVGTSFDRIVAEVWLNGENVNDYMRRQGYS